jgi:hypothetical protein
MVGEVRDTYLAGFSDSASAPLRLVASGQADGVFELVLPFTVESPVDPQAALAEGRFDGKLLIVNSAADDSGNLVDSGAHPDQYRFYAVAGTPHVSDPLVQLFSNETTPASWIPALRAHFVQAHRWVRNRVAPPPSSGVDGAPRLPFVELGEAVFHTGFLGGYDNVKTVTEPYRDHSGPVGRAYPRDSGAGLSGLGTRGPSWRGSGPAEERSSQSTQVVPVAARKPSTAVPMVGKKWSGPTASNRP